MGVGVGGGTGGVAKNGFQERDEEICSIKSVRNLNDYTE